MKQNARMWGVVLAILGGFLFLKLYIITYGQGAFGLKLFVSFIFFTIGISLFALAGISALRLLTNKESKNIKEEN